MREQNKSHLMVDDAQILQRMIFIYIEIKNVQHLFYIGSKVEHFEKSHLIVIRYLYT